MVDGGDVGEGCKVAKRESREEILAVSPSDRSGMACLVGLMVGALMVLVMVVIASGAWAAKRNRRGILLVFCQINLVGA